MDSNRKNMDNICSALEMMIDWISITESPPLIYAAEHKTRSENEPRPLLGVMFQAVGEYDEWIRAGKSCQLPEGHMAVGATHKGTRTSEPRGEISLWAAALDVEGVERFGFLDENPWWFTAPVRNPDNVISAFRALAIEYATNRHTQRYRVKAGLLTLFSMLIEQATRNEHTNRAEPPPTVTEAIRFIQARYADPSLTLDAIARNAGLSANHFVRVFSNSMGIPPIRYLNRARIERAKTLIDNTSLRMSEIAEEVGFNDPLYFSRVFNRMTGESPSAYRERRQSVLP